MQQFNKGRRVDRRNNEEYKIVLLFVTAILDFLNFLFLIKYYYFLVLRIVKNNLMINSSAFNKI